MLVLALRTDKPESEIGLFVDNEQLAYESWEAHRQLAETIHQKIRDMLKKEHKTLEDIEGLVVFKGPGSFTGLRIGITVANALAYSLSIPIVASGGDAWVQNGTQRLLAGENETISLPEYGGSINITRQKK